ncbi:MAG: multidrug effflux MFS transporter [Albidovulum sp.]|nr:multidrug effflux MFS transporter [Albidovulum sp.]MDE0305598.1 multidrug effflux MFS transporter [Albidovulum sp.]
MKTKHPPSYEFVALVALLISMVAFATDAMLPAFPEISADLDLPHTNHAQLVVIVFILGTGLGQLVMGPLSDSFGRKLIICIGLGMFFLASAWAFYAGSFYSMLAARFVQGIGVSAPRTVTQAMVRDRHSGRNMARVLSFAMMLFVLVPAVAPYIGQTIMLNFGWRTIFVAFQIIAVAVAVWLMFRQPETHSPDKRTRFRLATIAYAAAEVLSNRRVITCTFSLSLGLTCIFAYLVSAQQVYVAWLGAGHDFPFYFALVAIISGSASFLNALLVVRFGMWELCTFGYLAICLLSVAAAFVVFKNTMPVQFLLWMFVSWSTGMFFLLGLCLANLNALALEPMGHIAGMASSIIGAVSTLFCIMLAVPIGQLFDGTGFPLIAGVAICSGIAFVLNLSMRKQPLPAGPN